MRKLLTIIATMIMCCNAYGEDVYWVTGDTYSTATCNSGDNITKPADPEKEGYRFIGWREATTIKEAFPVRSKVYTPTNNSAGGTTWAVDLVYGTVSGRAMCSSTTCGGCGSDYESCSTRDSQPAATGTLQYCWCKIESATFYGEEQISLLPNIWQCASYSPIGASQCSSGCAFFCANRFYMPGFRKTFFGLNN